MSLRYNCRILENEFVLLKRCLVRNVSNEEGSTANV